MKNKNLLAPLAFGSASALTIDSLQQYEDMLSDFIPNIKCLNHLEDSTPFQVKACSINVNGLAISAISNNACSLELTHESDNLTLFLPYSNMTEIYCGKDKMSIQDGHSASLVRYFSAGNDSNKCSGVSLSVDDQRLKKMYESMTKTSFDAIDFNLDNPHQFLLKYGDFSFDQAFRQLYRLIELHNGNQISINTSGIDEMFYRNLVMMIAPKTFFGDEKEVKLSTKSMHDVISHLLEIIHEYPHEVRNLSDIERITGLRARSLQYIFKSTMDCTPMQWLRFQRLKYARSLFLNDTRDHNISSVSRDLGFSNYSTFAKYYFEAFGELPSKTRKNNQ